MNSSGPSLKQTVSQKQKIAVRTIVICSVAFIAITATLFVYFNLGTSHNAKANGVTPAFIFSNPTIQNGTGGAIGCVYKFGTVLTGVDAYITLADIGNGASLSNIDIPQATTGYENAFQPYVTFKAGTASVPQTSYIEWNIEFKKAGTLTDTILPAVSVTAIDIDGNSSIQESVSAPRPTSYSTQPGTLLSITQNATTLTAVAPSTDFGGIDSSNRNVMFQMNFTNINNFVYRTVGINKASAISRQFSIYFKTFFISSPLPVELIKFEGAIQDKSSVNLVWTTASEINNDYFQLERSSDGINFEKVGTIKGSGTTSETQTYSYLDREMPAGVNYYRLIQIDFNGKTETFKPIIVQSEKEEGAFEITNAYPNPFNSRLNIYYRIAYNAPVKITLLNATGQQIILQNENATQGTNFTTLTGLDALPKGQYFLTVSYGDKNVKTKKVVKK